ncbi:2TM domain-containing protein [Kaistella palustris]|uniref:2TM domain-containing protein n=1 Tax=Kaistella palustris TaxID=493376 RepID=UPI0004149928|nr:2TM domain-containing protein [Kaistella palustris]
MENLTNTQTDYAVARAKVEQMKKFYASAAIFILVFAAYSLRKYYKTGDLTFFEFREFTILFWIWGIILAAKAFKIFFFNHAWEKRMIQKELNNGHHGKF